MMRAARPFARRYRHGAFLVGALLLTIIVLLVSFLGRRTLALDVGTLGDSPFLSGFHADEADVGYRYRWTTGHAEVRLDGAGSGLLSGVSVLAQGPQLSGSAPATMTVSLNGRPLQPEGDLTAPYQVTLTGELRPYTFAFGTDSPDGQPPPVLQYTISIDSSTFQPPGDARRLGVKVARVELSAGD